MFAGIDAYFDLRSNIFRNSASSTLQLVSIKINYRHLVTDARTSRCFILLVSVHVFILQFFSQLLLLLLQQQFFEKAAVELRQCVRVCRHVYMLLNDVIIIGRYKSVARRRISVVLGVIDDVRRATIDVVRFLYDRK